MSRNIAGEYWENGIVEGWMQLLFVNSVPCGMLALWNFRH